MVKFINYYKNFNHITYSITIFAMVFWIIAFLFITIGDLHAQVLFSGLFEMILGGPIVWLFMFINQFLNLGRKFQLDLWRVEFLFCYIISIVQWYVLLYYTKKNNIIKNFYIVYTLISILFLLVIVIVMTIIIIVIFSLFQKYNLI